jgi:hypothetical protein
MEEREEGWALLLDGALPAICAAIESPVDAHYKFHAAAALKSALTRAKQIAEKDALSEAAGDEALDGDFKNDAMDVDFTVKADALCGKAGCEDDRNDSYPRPHGPLTLSNALSTRVLNILWANWEDPLSQTVKEVQGAFEQLLDVKSRQKAGQPLKPSTLYPLPSYPLPSTLYPLPSTLYPLPSTLYPLPSTLYPLPSTLYPQP